METKEKVQTRPLHGSFFNYLMGNNKTIPKVGEGATILHWTDRSAYEVMFVSENGRTVEIQRYDSERTDNLGMSDSQSYKYEKFTGEIQTIVWKWGSWKQVNRQIVLTPEFQEELESREGPPVATEEERARMRDKDGLLVIIPGMTMEKVFHSKVNILWGSKREYYDYSF